MRHTGCARPGRSAGCSSVGAADVRVTDNTSSTITVAGVRVTSADKVTEGMNSMGALCADPLALAIPPSRVLRPCDPGVAGDCPEVPA